MKRAMRLVTIGLVIALGLTMPPALLRADEVI